MHNDIKRIKRVVRHLQVGGIIHKTIQNGTESFDIYSNDGGENWYRDPNCSIFYEHNWEKSSFNAPLVNAFQDNKQDIQVPLDSNATLKENLKFVPNLTETAPTQQEVDNLEEIVETKKPSQLHIGGEDNNKNASPFATSLVKAGVDTFNKIGDALPTNTDGPEGSTRIAAESVYNSASNVISQINPLVGNIMKVSGTTNKILESIGIGGTDNMTKGDAILGAIPVLNQINGLFGKTSDKFSID